MTKGKGKNKIFGNISYGKQNDIATENPFEFANQEMGEKSADNQVQMVGITFTAQEKNEVETGNPREARGKLAPHQK